jgi:hypothetical protein
MACWLKGVVSVTLAMAFIIEIKKVITVCSRFKIAFQGFL